MRHYRPQVIFHPTKYRLLWIDDGRLGLFPLSLRRVEREAQKRKVNYLWQLGDRLASVRVVELVAARASVLVLADHVFY